MTLKLFWRCALFLFCALSLIPLSGCATLSDAPSQIINMPKGKKIYYFHSGDSVWVIYPVPVENGMFSGIIVDPASVADNKLREINIYAAPPSAIRIEDHTLTCPMENIGKVENYKIKTGTIITSIGVVLLLFTVPIFL